MNNKERQAACFLFPIEKENQEAGSEEQGVSLSTRRFGAAESCAERDCPEHQMFHSTAGLFLLDAGNTTTPHPHCDNQKYLQMVPH